MRLQPLLLLTVQHEVTCGLIFVLGDQVAAVIRIARIDFREGCIELGKEVDPLRGHGEVVVAATDAGDRDGVAVHDEAGCHDGIDCTI